MGLLSALLSTSDRDDKFINCSYLLHYFFYRALKHIEIKPQIKTVVSFANQTIEGFSSK